MTQLLAPRLVSDGLKARSGRFCRLLFLLTKANNLAFYDSSMAWKG
jgi:hypothetical protein